MYYSPPITGMAGLGGPYDHRGRVSFLASGGWADHTSASGFYYNESNRTLYVNSKPVGYINLLNGSSATAQSFSDVDDTNVTLAIATVTGTGVHTFTMGWNGTLGISRGGTNASVASGARINLLPTLGVAGTVLTVNPGQTDVIWSTPPGGGDVTGPSSSTDRAVARFSGTGGKTLLNSGFTISDANVLAGATINATTALQYNGTDINTGGTLSNVAYEDQANVFTLSNSFQAATVSITLGKTAGGNRGIIRLVDGDGANYGTFQSPQTLSDNTKVWTLPSTTGTLALTADLSSYVPTSRTLTITAGNAATGGGGPDDLSANRSWTLGVDGSKVPMLWAANIFTTSNQFRGATYSVQLGSSGGNAGKLRLYDNDATNYGTLQTATNLTDDTKVWSLPDSTGTIALTSDLGSYVPTSRTLTVTAGVGATGGGGPYDLSTNRSWTLGVDGATIPTLWGTNQFTASNYFRGATFSVQLGYSGGNAGVMRIYDNDATNYGTLQTVTNLTDNNKVWSLPDSTGTIALTSDLGSYVPTSRTLTVTAGVGATGGGGPYDLTSNRSWTVGIDGATIPTLWAANVFTASNQFRGGTYSIQLGSSGGNTGKLRIYDNDATNYGTLQTVTNLSDDNKVWSLPDTTGTIALTADLSNYVPSSRTLTITAGTGATGGGGPYDLTSNRSWTVGVDGATVPTLWAANIFTASNQFRGGTYSIQLGHGGGNAGIIRMYDSDATNYGTLQTVTNLTDNTKVWSLPDSTGTIALTADLSNYVPTSRSITLTAGTSISITGGTQTLGADRTWTIGLTTPVSVANGGTGANSLTGLLQGNTTSAFTAISNSSTVGQVLRVTGTSTYAWGALDLADSDAITSALGATNGGTAQTSYAQGDTIYASASNTLSKLTIGTVGKILRSSGTIPAWSTLTLADSLAAGDLIYAYASNAASGLTIGTSGKFLRTNGTLPSWQNIAETDITDGSTYARMAAAEEVTASWVFNTTYIQLGKSGSSAGSIRIYDNDATNYGTLQTVANLTDNNKVWSLPDNTGTIALTADLSSYVPGSRTLTITAGTGATGGGGPYDLTSNRSWTIGVDGATIPTLWAANIFTASNQFRGGTYSIQLGHGGGNAGIIRMYDSDATNYGTLQTVTNLTDNTKVWSLPDNTGTIALTADLSSYVPTSRTLTITAGTGATGGGGPYDLNSNRSWTLGVDGAMVPLLGAPNSFTQDQTLSSNLKFTNAADHTIYIAGGAGTGNHLNIYAANGTPTAGHVRIYGGSGSTNGDVILSHTGSGVQGTTLIGTATAQAGYQLVVGGATYLSGNAYQTGKFTQYNNVALEAYGLPAIVDYAFDTGRYTDVSYTNISGTNTAGTYRISVYYGTYNTDTETATCSLTVKWTDNPGNPHTHQGTLITANANGVHHSFVILVKHTPASGEYIQFTFDQTGSSIDESWEYHVVTERIN